MEINPKTVRAEAEKEVAEELTKRAKETYKRKLRELKAAERVVANIQRELEDLDVQIEQGKFA